MQLALLSKQGDISCPPEHQDLIEKNKALQEKNKLLSVSLDGALRQTTSLLERAVIVSCIISILRFLFLVFSALFMLFFITFNLIIIGDGSIPIILSKSELAEEC